MTATRRVFFALTGGLAAGLGALGLGRSVMASETHEGHEGHLSPKSGVAKGRMVEIAAGPAPAVRTRVPPPPADGSYRPVVTPNGSSLPWQVKDGVKEFRLVAQKVRREFAPGMVVNAWGYNGETPGPTIEAVEGDRVRILVENRLPEETAMHWHGMRVPSGMDGVVGLTQRAIPPGRIGVYEFTLEDSGTFMYHPHADEMFQIGMGMMGFFIVHPKDPQAHRVDRDFAIMLHAWDVKPGTSTPNTATMLDFNAWTFNSRVFPGTDPLPVRLGDRVRLRFANLSMTAHPLHMHGHRMELTGTDGGWVPPSARFPVSTVDLPVGQVLCLEWVADRAGDWALHCHKSHHTMNAMAHDIPNLTGVETDEALEKRMRGLLPQYMAMGGDGMADMADMAMPMPPNTLPMMGGAGPFGPVGMGGMLTVVKVREGLAPGDYRDPGWYAHPPGTVMRLLDA